jgi:hypothetical protein
MSADRKTLVRFIQDAIDKGATMVEEVHKSIADLPLGILEESDLLRESAKEAQVGTYASELLADAAKRRAARREVATERR